MAKKKQNDEAHEPERLGDDDDLAVYFAGKWMKSENIDQDNDTVVTIVEVYKDQVEDDNGKLVTKVALEFEESEQLLGLNMINGRRIVALYGTKKRDWIGKRIALYVDHEVEFRGNTTPAIRIRARAPQAKRSRRRR